MPRVILSATYPVFFYTLIFSLLLKSAVWAQDRDFQAELEFYQLENEVVVSATRSQSRLKDAPAAVYVITAKQIRERGYHSLIDALHDVPGFSFQHTYGTFPHLIHQRGIVGNNQRSQIYIDGVLDNNLTEGNINGLSILYPLYNVERIEIMAGPASALYGANAFNGIINIVTKNGADENGSELSFMVGSWNDDFSYTGYNINFNARQGNQDQNMSVAGYYYHSDGPDFRGIQNVKADEDSTLRGYWWSDFYDLSWQEAYHITGKAEFDNLRFQFVTWQNLMGGGTFANGFAALDNSKVNSLLEEKIGEKGDVTTPYSWSYRNNSALVGFTSQATKKLSLDSSATVRHSEVLSYNTYTEIDGYNNPERFDTPTNLTEDELDCCEDWGRDDYQIQVAEKIDYKQNNKLKNTLGIEFQHTQVPAGYGAKTTYEYDNLGAYLQSIFSPNQDLSLIGGYRFDHNTIYGNVHTPRLSAIYHLNSDLTLKALFSTGFREPTAHELFNATDARKANPNLSPEKLLAGEIGLGLRFLEHYYANVQTYYNQISDLIIEVQTNEVNPDKNGYWNQNQNVGQVKVIGLESQLDANISRQLNIFANYTLTLSEYTEVPFEKKASLVAVNSMAMPIIPKHTLNFGITYYFLEKLSVNLRANFVGVRKNLAANPEKSVEDYMLMYVNLRWQDVLTEGFFMQLTINNLLNAQAWDPGVRSQSGSYYPSRHPIAGRNIWLTSGMHF